MNITLFIALLTAFSIASATCVEGVKNLLNELNVSYSCNIVALIVSCVVGGFGTVIYFVLHGMPFTFENIVFIIGMCLASAVSSMVGYDKVIQTIEQMKYKM